MKLTLEVDPKTYERIERGELSVLYARVPEIEVRQEDGLLSFTRRVVSIVEARWNKPNPELPDDEPGVPVVVYLPYVDPATYQQEGPCPTT